MSNFYKALQKLLLALIVVGIAACNSETTSSKQISEKSISDVAGKYPGKPHAPVDMVYKFTTNKTPMAGENVDIELTFKVKQAVNDLIINLSADSGLDIMNNSLQHSMGAKSISDQSVLNLTVTSGANGYYYAYITVILVFDGKRQSRNFAIPVNVGNIDPKQSMKPIGVLHEDATGQKIISMPASQPRK